MSTGSQRFKNVQSKVFLGLELGRAGSNKPTTSTSGGGAAATQSTRSPRRQYDSSTLGLPKPPPKKKKEPLPEIIVTPDGEDEPNYHGGDDDVYGSDEDLMCAEPEVDDGIDEPQHETGADPMSPGDHLLRDTSVTDEPHRLSVGSMDSFDCIEQSVLQEEQAGTELEVDAAAAEVTPDTKGGATTTKTPPKRSPNVKSAISIGTETKTSPPPRAGLRKLRTAATAVTSAVAMKRAAASPGTTPRKTLVSSSSRFQQQRESEGSAQQAAAFRFQKQRSSCEAQETSLRFALEDAYLISIRTLAAAHRHVIAPVLEKSSIEQSSEIQELGEQLGKSHMEIAQLMKRVQVLSSENTTLKRQVASFEGDLSTLGKTQETNTDSLKEAQAELARVEKREQDLVTDLQNVTERERSVSLKNAELHKEMNSLREQLERLSASNAAALQDVQHIHQQQTSSRSQSVVSQKSHCSPETSTHGGGGVDVSVDNDTMSVVSATTATTIDHDQVPTPATSTNHEATIQAAAAALSAQQQQQDSALISTLQTELALMKDDMASNQKHIAVQEEQVFRLRASNTELEALVKEKQAFVGQLKMELDQAQGSLQRKEGDIVRLTNDVNALQSKVSDYQQSANASRANAQELSAKVKVLEGEKDKLVVENEDISKKIEGLEEQLSKSINRQEWYGSAVESCTALMHPIKQEITQYELTVQRVVRELANSNRGRGVRSTKAADLRRQQALAASGEEQQLGTSFSSLSVPSPRVRSSTMIGTTPPQLGGAGAESTNVVRTLNLNNAGTIETSSASSPTVPEQDNNNDSDTDTQSNTTTATTTAQQFCDATAGLEMTLQSNKSLIQAIKTLEVALTAKDFEMRKNLIQKEKLRVALNEAEKVIDGMRDEFSRKQHEWRDNMMNIVQDFSRFAGFDNLIEDVYNVKQQTAHVAELRYLLEHEKDTTEMLRRRCTVLERHLEDAAVIAASGRKDASNANKNNAELPGVLISPRALVQTPPATEDMRQLAPQPPVHGFLFTEKANLKPVTPRRIITSPLPEPTSPETNNNNDLEEFDNRPRALIELEEKMTKVEAVTKYLVELEQSAQLSTNGVFRKQMIDEMKSVHESLSFQNAAVVVDAQTRLKEVAKDFFNN